MSRTRRLVLISVVTLVALLLGWRHLAVRPATAPIQSWSAVEGETPLHRASYVITVMTGPEKVAGMRVLAEESATSVRLTATYRTTMPHPWAAVHAIGRVRQVLVTLDSPIGDRTVVDATTGQPVPRHR